MAERTSQERRVDAVEEGKRWPAVPRGPSEAALLLSLQRHNGNRAVSGLVSRARLGSVSRPTIQRVTTRNAALHKIAQLLLNTKTVSGLGQAQELVTMRQQIEKDIEDAREAGNNDPGRDAIAGSAETRLGQLETIVVNNAIGQVDIAGTDTKAYKNAATLVAAGGGEAASLAEALVVARINRAKKMDLTIKGGTNAVAVVAAVAADGYQPFQHVGFTATAVAGSPEEYTIALTNPAHPFAAEFLEHIQQFLNRATFTTYLGENDEIRVSTPNAVGLNAALATWHPGIASDKTQPGEYRHDQPHPGVTNPIHNSHEHVHLQPPGGMQTTIVI